MAEEGAAVATGYSRLFTHSPFATTCSCGGVEYIVVTHSLIYGCSRRIMHLHFSSSLITKLTWLNTKVVQPFEISHTVLSLISALGALKKVDMI